MTCREGAVATLERAGDAGLHIELVALDPGEAPDWEEAGRYIDAIGLEEINDDLLELCGVDPDRDPQDTWLDTVKERLRQDLESFRGDIEGDQDEIEEWDFRDGSIFASVGSLDDEANPVSGHGWLTRLLDAGVLGVAGFARVRKADSDLTRERGARPKPGSVAGQRSFDAPSSNGHRSAPDLPATPLWPYEDWAGVALAFAWTGLAAELELPASATVAHTAASARTPTIATSSADRRVFRASSMGLLCRCPAAV